MDPQWFDALVRALRAPGSRRVALQLLAGLLGVAAFPTPIATRIGCRRVCRQTSHGRSCRIVCRCSDGQTKCRTGPRPSCVDLLSDPAHCGTCGIRCAALQRCRLGACSGPSRCLAGLTLCGDDCVDLQRDPVHCGACGAACGGLRPCQGGVCGPAPSPCAGMLTFCKGACVDTRTDAANCGDCGQACPSGASCQSGKCVSGGAGGACAPYGQDCATAADCCPTAAGVAVPCISALCRFN